MRLLNRVPMLTDWIRQRQFQRQRESRRQRESHAKREKFSQVVIQHLKMPMYLLRQKFFQSLAAPLLALPQFLRRQFRLVVLQSLSPVKMILMQTLLLHSPVRPLVLGSKLLRLAVVPDLVD
jgi:hypothetical protein